MLRLGILSDLHAAARQPQAVDAVAGALADGGADWLICAGDIGGGGAADALACLRTLDAAIGGRVLFVPGNHDIWCHPRASGDSWDEWKKLLGFPGNLERGPRDLGDGWRAVGTGGWYDYSLGVPGPWTADDVARKQWENVVWQDARFARWGATDPEVADGFLRLLEQRLDEAASGEARVVAVTHVVPFAGVLAEPSEEPSRAFTRAFMGSAAYGAAMVRHGCGLAVFGHSHVRRRGTAEGGLQYVAAPLGYPKEWAGSGDLADEIRSAMAIFDLPAHTGAPLNT